MSLRRAAIVIRYSVLLFVCGIVHAADEIVHVPTGVIFSAALAEKDGGQDFGGLTPPFWTPNAGEVETAEIALRKYLEASGDPAVSAIGLKLDTYRRQYVGDSHGGDRSILVNAFCVDYLRFNAKWETRFVVVLDGGDCFFRARLDLRTSTINMFEVNGSA